MIGLATKGEPLSVVGDGLQRWDFLCIDDLTQFIDLALRRSVSGVFNVSMGGASIMDLAEAVCQACGNTMELQSVGGSGECRSLDVSLARNLLGWEAPTTLDDGIATLVEDLAK